VLKRDVKLQPIIPRLLAGFRGGTKLGRRGKGREGEEMRREGRSAPNCGIVYN